MNEKVKEKLKAFVNATYTILAILLCAVLVTGLLRTYHKMLYGWGDVGRDIVWLCFFYILAFLFIVQFLVIWLLGKVTKKSKLCCSIILFNFVAMMGTFSLYSLYKLVVPTIRFSSSGVIRWILIDLLWPAGLVWCSHSLISAITFAVLASAISTCLQYFFLRKDTASKKLLLTSLLVSTLLCYSAITIFFYFNY